MECPRRYQRSCRRCRCCRCRSGKLCARSRERDWPQPRDQDHGACTRARRHVDLKIWAYAGRRSRCCCQSRGCSSRPGSWCTWSCQGCCCTCWWGTLPRPAKHARARQSVCAPRHPGIRRGRPQLTCARDGGALAAWAEVASVARARRGAARCEAARRARRASRGAARAVRVARAGCRVRARNAESGKATGGQGTGARGANIQEQDERPGKSAKLPGEQSVRDRAVQRCRVSATHDVEAGLGCRPRTAAGAGHGRADRSAKGAGRAV